MDIKTERPVIVCLCGSIKKARSAFQAYQQSETLAGRIVLTVGSYTITDEEVLEQHSFRRRKAELDVLHFHKIAMADEILVLNLHGYIGESTEREIAWAKSLGKRIRYIEDVNELQKDSQDTKS